TMSGGTLTITAGAITTINQRDGKLFYNGSGVTIGTTNVHGGATFDLTQGQGTVTMTTINLFPGAKFFAPKGRFAATPTFRLNGCTIDKVTIVCGDDFNVVHV